MNRDDIIRMAREAGSIDSEEVIETVFAAFAAVERNRTWTQEHWTEYERSIAAAEREACAELCEQMDHDGVMIAADCADTDVRLGVLGTTAVMSNDRETGLAADHTLLPT